MLRAGVVGLGVGEQHVHGLERDGLCRVEVLCDVDPDKLAAVGARHPGRRLETDPARVLGDPALDLIAIASPDDAHHAQVLAALAAGKHVFAEKPLCLSAEELADIAAALDADPRLRLSSNHVLRASPRFVDLRRRIRAGELGALYRLEGTYLYGRISKIIHGWRGRLPHYSVMLGGGIHLIDLMGWLAGVPVVEAAAFGTDIATRGTTFRRPDTVVGLLRFADGAVGQVSADFGCVHPHHHALAVHGTAGTFVNDRGPARLYTDRDPAVPPHLLDTPYPGVHKGDLAADFVRALVAGTDPLVDEADVMAVMATGLALDRSLAEGGHPVPVRPPRLRARVVGPQRLQ